MIVLSTTRRRVPVLGLLMAGVLLEAGGVPAWAQTARERIEARRKATLDARAKAKGGLAPADAPAAAATPEPVTPVGAQLDADVLKKVKGATARLRVSLPNKSIAEGSGFFGVEPGIVLTNAHVLGMFKSDSRRPQKVEAVVESGEKDERTLTGQVLGVDVNSDLAVLRVTGPNLPEPLPVDSAKDLQETQSVYVFGFPFGTSLGKAITVSTSSVSSLRKNNAGVLQRVQVNGGMNPGNSGGPVVAMNGHVVGVAVSGIGRSQISFAVPGDAVSTMLAGKVGEVVYGYPYKDGSKVKVPVEVRMIDPLKKIDKVEIVCWSAPTAKNRADAPPAPAAGSPKRQDLTVTPKDGVATADFTLPPLEDKEVSWFQASFTDGHGDSQKRLPYPFPAKPPVDRVPVVLALRHTAGAKANLEMISNTEFTLRTADGDELTFTSNMKAGLTEQVERVNPQGIAELHLAYRSFSTGLKINNQVIPKDKDIQRAVNDLGKVGTDYRMDSRGTLIENKLDLANVPRSSRAMVEVLATRIQQSIEAVELPLPGKLTEANAPWTGTRELPIDTPGEEEKGVVDMKYWYIGRRKRADGDDEALVEMRGRVRGRQGAGLGVGGRVRGLAFLDLNTGQVTQANVTTYIDMDLVLDRRPGKANGKLEVRLGRKPADGAPEKSTAKTP